MYTQCPDCATAFRVTADVLKQASGKVRCGGCGNAFDALAYLSETKPAKPSSDDANEAFAKLAPDLSDENTEDKAPEAISAEQSAALLKTLDDLAGSDIRLEDTGIEWRLLPDDVNALDEATGVLTDVSGDTGASRIDEVLDDSATHINEILSDTPNEVEALEVFEEIETTPDDELRFDDDTGLPDDFDSDVATSRPSAPIPNPVVIPERRAARHVDESQVDLAFGDPEEWGDLLEEVDTDDEAADLGAPIIAPESTEHRDEVTGLTFAEELDALPDDEDEDQDKADVDTPPDIDTQFNLQAEALGIDLSGMRSTVDDDEAEDQDDVADEEATEIYTPTGEHTSLDSDLIAAAFEAEQAAEAAADASARNLALSLNEDAELDEDESEDENEIENVDTVGDEEEREQVEEQAEDTGENGQDDALEEDIEFFPDSTGALESELAIAQKLSDELLDSPEYKSSEAEPADGQLVFDKPEIDDAEIAVAIMDDIDTETVVLPESEEEQTINRMIDQDLLRLAIEDDEGVASTMVLQGKGLTNGNESTGGDDSDAVSDAFGDLSDGTGVETIIMEGEFVRTALEQEALEASAANEKVDIDDIDDIDDESDTDDAEVGFIAAAKKTFRGHLPSADSPRSFNTGMTAGLVVMALLLIGQFVHQSRAELATIPAVNTVIGPVYRAVGAPITPEWDVTGWRFEVTRGSTSGGEVPEELDVPSAATGDDVNSDGPAEADAIAETAATLPDPEVLTIFSRLGNKSSQPLPYPLITVSLTDRFEETIGSKVLEPGDYLSANIEVGQMVPPGNTFNAAIAIETPSANATGFKLNVCYRQAGGLLRCAIEDFK